MIDTLLPGNASPALARFADVLCMYNLEVFSEQLRCLLAGPPSPIEERAIMFRLADHAVRVCAVETLEAEDRSMDADTLRRLTPITDQAAARAARLALDSLTSKPVGHARGAAHFACCDADDSCAPGRAAEHAAYAVAQAAACHADPEHTRRVYSAAVELLGVLRNARP